jgi:hypothetical protein
VRLKCPHDVLHKRLTAWRRVLLEKLIFLQIIKEYPALHGTGMYIPVFTKACKFSLS